MIFILSSAPDATLAMRILSGCADQELQYF